MTYREQLQRKNEQMLQKCFDNDNVPMFIQDYFLDIASRASRRNYWITIRDMLKYFMSICIINKQNISDIIPSDLESIKKQHIIKYLSYLKYDKKIKLNTLNTKRNQISSFWEYLKTSHYVSDNVVQAVKSEEFKPTKTNRMKAIKMPLHEDICTLINNISSKPNEFLRTRNLTIVRVLRGTGLRVSELVGLDISDLYLDEEYPYIYVISKGSYDYSDDGKDIVYLTHDAWMALTEWIKYRESLNISNKDQNAVFINKTGKRMIESDVQSMLKNNSNGTITPHMLRHEYVTLLSKESNGDIAFMVEQARHKSVNTTMMNYDSGSSKSLDILQRM